MLEESLAEVGQMEVDADWQAEVIKRLEKAKERQEKQREQLVNLSKQTCAKEEEVVQLMLEVEGKQVRIHMLKAWSHLRNCSKILQAKNPLHIVCTVVMYVAQLKQKSLSNQAAFCWSSWWIHVTNLNL